MSVWCNFELRQAWPSGCSSASQSGTPPASSGKSGGGGSFDPASLLALAGALGLRAWVARRSKVI